MQTERHRKHGKRAQPESTRLPKVARMQALTEHRRHGKQAEKQRTSLPKAPRMQVERQRRHGTRANPERRLRSTGSNLSSIGTVKTGEDAS